MFSTGYAAGLAMKKDNITKAGYVSGPEADFSKQAAAAFRAGLVQVVPEATLVETYTGDFNDSAKAKEAAQQQIAQGVGLIYPYLGGATDAVATLREREQGPDGHAGHGPLRGPDHAVQHLGDLQPGCLLRGCPR